MSLLLHLCLSLLFISWQVDPWLDLIAGAGLTLACVVLLLGAANVFIMLSLWILYHSLVAVGNDCFPLLLLLLLPLPPSLILFPLW